MQKHRRGKQVLQFVIVNLDMMARRGEDKQDGGDSEVGIGDSLQSKWDKEESK